MSVKSIFCLVAHASPDQIFVGVLLIGVGCIVTAWGCLYMIGCNKP